MVVDFGELLRRGTKAFPTQEAFAAALGISVGRLNRALNKRDYPLNVLNCLKLANLTGERASDVLRAAGKGDVAALLDELYGVGKETLTASERRALTLLASMNDDGRSTAFGILESLAKAFPREQPQQSPGRSTRTPPATKRTARGTR